MKSAFVGTMTDFYHKNAAYIVLFLWVIGVSVGRQFCRGDPDAISVLMRTALECRVSIVGLFCMLFLPQIFNAFAIYRRMPVIVFAMVLWKAICFGFVFAAIGITYTNASWLVRFLLLCSDCVGIACCIWLFLRHGTQMRRPSFSVDFIGCICLCFAAGVIDYFLISPFAAAL